MNPFWGSFHVVITAFPKSGRMVRFTDILKMGLFDAVIFSRTAPASKFALVYRASIPRHSDLSHLEGDIAAVGDELGRVSK